MKNYEKIKVVIMLSSNDVITTSGEVTFDEVDKDIWTDAYETDN